MTAAFCAFLCSCDPIATIVINLKLEPGSEEPRTKKALEVVDQTLRAEGFNPIKSSFIEPPYLAGYHGPGRSGCMIKKESGNLQILFSEMGRLRSRKEVKEAGDNLRQKLIEEFGKETVASN